MDLIVRELVHGDEAAFLEGLKEWEGESSHWHTFSWKPGMAFEEMLAILRKEAAGVDLAPGRVPHTMLYGFLDERIIGRVSVRHELNESLRRRGGHLGYAVAPRFRRQGHASRLAREGLALCRRLGIAKVMVTCSDENAPSWRIIERLGGVLDDKIWDDEDRETIRRYHVDV